MTARTIRRSLPLVSRIQKELCGVQAITETPTLKTVTRKLANTSSISNQLAQKLKIQPKYTAQDIGFVEVKEENKKIKLKFNNGTESVALHVWLRDNCQCPECFDQRSFSRKNLLIDLDIKVKPMTVENYGTKLKVVWSDLHASEFDAKWLFDRVYTPEATETYKNFYKIDKEVWGSDVILDRFDFMTVLEDEEYLLEWLTTMESKGIALIESCPDDADAGPKFINKIGYVKASHFGWRAPIKLMGDAKHLAYTSLPLALHSDLPCYSYMPGLSFLHTVMSHQGEGGGNLVADGVFGSKMLREKDPDGYKLLCDTDIYFSYRGIGADELQKKEMHKINKSPVIELDSEGEFQSVRMSSWGRDSHIFLPDDVMYRFYEALTSLNKIFYDNCLNYKMKTGEMLVMDNYRCIHGREGYTCNGSRHLETCYVDWDDFQCTRRCLQDRIYKLNM